MATERGFAVTPRLIVGLTVLALGVAFLLDRMGTLDAGAVLRYWPVALLALGVACALQARETGGRVFGAAAALAGLWFLAELRGWVDSNPFILLRYFWPAVLLAAGGVMVWRSLAGPRGDSAAASPADRLSSLALLSGVELRNASQSFAGGHLTAVMGGCEIDLRQAKLGADEVAIEVFALWGGIEIKVPPSWEVVGKVMPLLGGFESKAAVPPAGAPRLVVSGSAIMGGVGVSN